MSSLATGCMVTSMPKKNVKKFESYFSGGENEIFPNVRLELAQERPSKTPEDGYVELDYTITCGYTLYGDLLEYAQDKRSKSFVDVCVEVGVISMNTDVANSYEGIYEELFKSEGENLSYIYESYALGERDMQLVLMPSLWSEEPGVLAAALRLAAQTLVSHDEGIPREYVPKDKIQTYITDFLSEAKEKNKAAEEVLKKE